MPEITQILVNTSGAVAVTFIFLWYQSKDKKEMIRSNEEIGRQTRKVIENNTASNLVLSSKLSDLSNSDKELRDIIEHLYIELLRKSDRSKIAKYYEKTQSERKTI